MFFFISLNIKLKRLSIDDVSTAETLMNIGDIFIKKGNSNEQYKIKGRFYYEKALKIYKINKHVNGIHILNGIGHIYENIHKYRLANDYYSEAFENYVLSNDTVKKTCENNLARIKWFNGVKNCILAFSIFSFTVLLIFHDHVISNAFVLFYFSVL